MWFVGGGGVLLAMGHNLADNVTVQVRLSDRVDAMFYLVEDLT